MKKLFFIILILTSFYCRSQTPITFGKVTINSDVSTSATTLSDITDLSFPVTSGDLYYFKFVINYTTDASTTGSGWSVNGPAATFVSFRATYPLMNNTSTTINCTALNCFINNASSMLTANLCIMEGIYLANGNGNLIGRFASEVVSPGTVTVKANSTWLLWQKIK